MNIQETQLDLTLKYFVYSHTRLDNNQVFYIGLGTVRQGKKAKPTEKHFNRAFNKSHRSLFWKRITDKVLYKIDIVFQSDDLESVKNKEIELIGLFGRLDKGVGSLVNMTDGGDGTFGRVTTLLQRKELSTRVKHYLSDKKGRESVNAKPCYMYDTNGNYIKSFKAVCEIPAALGFAKKHFTFKNYHSENGLYYTKGFQFSYEYFGETVSPYVRTFLTKRTLAIVAQQGEEVLEFESIKHAALFLGGNYNSNRSSINSCLKGERKTALGYTFKIKNNQDAN